MQTGLFESVVSWVAHGFVSAGSMDSMNIFDSCSGFLSAAAVGICDQTCETNGLLGVAFARASKQGSRNATFERDDTLVQVCCRSLFFVEME